MPSLNLFQAFDSGHNLLFKHTKTHAVTENKVIPRAKQADIPRDISLCLLQFWKEHIPLPSISSLLSHVTGWQP